MIRAARLAALSALIFFVPIAAAPQEAGQIDYDGFAKLVAEVEPYRAERRVSLDEFHRMAAEPNTIILDARSATNYRIGHIDGAINLEFTDFSVPRLEEVIPSKDTRILIYCNNNFTDDRVPIYLKSAPLALNVPTFINLYGYGYTNVYELDGAFSITDPAIRWVTPHEEN